MAPWSRRAPSVLRLIVQRAGVAAGDPAVRPRRRRRVARRRHGRQFGHRDPGTGAAERHACAELAGHLRGRSSGRRIGGVLHRRAERASRPPARCRHADPAVRLALWAAKVAIYLGIAIGIGGAFFRAWIAAPIGEGAVRDGIGDRAQGVSQAEPFILAASIAGLGATALSVGLQGLDALELPLREIGRSSRLGNRACHVLRPDRDRAGICVVCRRVLVRRAVRNAQSCARAHRARRCRHRTGAERSRQQRRAPLAQPAGGVRAWRQHGVLGRRAAAAVVRGAQRQTGRRDVGALFQRHSNSTGAAGRFRRVARHRAAWPHRRAVDHRLRQGARRQADRRDRTARSRGRQSLPDRSAVPRERNRCRARNCVGRSDRNS